MTNEQIGSVIYAANGAYCEAIGDAPQLPFDVAKESIISGIDGNDGNTPEQSHEAWLSYKEADGWVYGPVKDADAKTHPCMVPYDQLPAEQKVKDDLFLAIVGALKDRP